MDATTLFGDDLDLDALMLRVREAAMSGAAGSGPAQPQGAGEANAPELGLIRVLEAQSEWNEQARQSLAALVECIRILRDDWADVQTGLRREISQLSALVEKMRPAAATPSGPSGARGNTRPRTRRAAAAPRGTGKPRGTGGRRPRS